METPVITNLNDCTVEYCIPPCLEPGDGNQLRNTYYTEKANYLSASAEYVVNPSDSLLNLMAYSRYQMDHAAYALVVDMIYDTITHHVDSLLTWVEHLDCQTGDLWLAGLAMHRGETSQAYALVEEMALTYDLTSVEAEDMSDYRDILGLMAGKDLYQLDSLTLDTLLTYDELEGYSGTLARSILTLYGAHYPPSYPEVAGLRSTYSFGHPESIDGVPSVLVHPNPSNGDVYFAIKAKEQPVNSILRIWDQQGRLIRELSIDASAHTITWSTENEQRGIYFYQIIRPGLNNISGKVILN